MPNKKIDVSIVVACYNGEKIIEEGVRKLKEVLDAIKYEYEFVFVDDCSQDASASVAKKIVMQLGEKGIFMQHERNTGRGKTVTDGIKQASGRIVGSIDIDLETPAYYILPIINAIENGADIAIAQRIYKIDVTSPNTLVRYFLHRGYKYISRLLLGTPVMDTETGCKFFRRDKIMSILDEVDDPGWFWDTEIMIRAYYTGLNIVEVPTIFIKREDGHSTVRIFHDTKDYATKLLKFRKEVEQLRK